MIVERGPGRNESYRLENENPVPCDAGLVKAGRSYFRRRNSSKLKPPKPTTASVVGSGTAVIIISPLGESSGLAMPEISARVALADESMMEPPPPPLKPLK